MPALIDTHAHLDFPHFRRDLEEVLKRARQAGLVAILNSAADEQSAARALALSLKHPMISASVGIHPHNAEKVAAGWLERLEKLALNETVLAVGEIGLDFYRNLSPRETQIEVFKEQLLLACRLNKPVIIHSREANKSVLQVFREEELPAARGVMHCFSGSLEEMEAFVDLGLYISIAGPVTYPRNHKLRALLKHIPLNRLLLETDAPYLPPQAYRSKRNEPSYVKLTYERVALELNLSVEELANHVYLNAVRLFSDLLVDRAG